MGHIMHDIAQPNRKNSFGVCEGRITKVYGNNSKRSNILVVCYFRVGAKMQNVGDGES
jgi:hypothetical protein